MPRKKDIVVSEKDFRLTPSGVGRYLKITPSAVVALANRKQIACVRDSSGRRLFSMHDVYALDRNRKLKKAALRTRGR